MSSNRRRVDVFAHHQIHTQNQSAHTDLLNEIKNSHHQDGAGGGTKPGVMTDSIASSNNTISAQSVLTASRLNNIQNAITQDGVGGGNKLGVMTDAINTNIIASNAKLDTIATNTENININVGDVEVNVNDLEVLQLATKNTLFTNPNGTGNTIGENASAINANINTANGKLDTIITNTAAGSSSGLATESTLQTIAEFNCDTTDVTVTSLVPGVAATSLGKAIQSAQGATDTGVATLAVRNDTLADLAGADHDYAPLQVDASGALYTRSMVTDLAITASNNILTTIDEDTNAIKIAVESLDNAVDGNYLNVNQNIAGTDVDSNSGNKSAASQRVVIATDDVNLSAIKTSVQLIDNAMHTGVIPSAALNVSVASSTLPAGAATDNFISSMRVREDEANTAGQYLMGVSAVIRQDTLASLVGTSGDNTQMSVDANGALYNISPTANALLTTIDEDTNDIKTSVQLLDDVVGTDGATGPTKCLSMAGTESGGAIQELLVDSSGHLQIDVLSAPSTVVTNSVLTSFNDAINSSRVDVNIANGGFGGAVTNDGLTAIDAAIGTDGSTGPAKCMSMAGTESGGAIQELLVDSSGHLQIDVISAPSTVVTNSVLTSFNDAINSSRVDVNIANGGFGGAVTNDGLTAIDAAIGTDGSTGPAKCMSMAGTESGGAIQELLVDSSGHLQIDVLSAPSTVVTNSVLTSFNDAINSSRVDVNIANGGFGGAVTNDGLTAIDAAIGTDGSTGPAKCMSMGGTESGGAIQELLVDANGHLQIDVISAPSTAVTGTVTATLSATDNAVIDVIAAKSTLGTTSELKELLSGVTVNSGAQSAQFDTENYDKARFFGETTASVGTDIILMGAATDGGQAYVLGENLRSESIGGVHYIYGSLVENLPKYIRILNKSGSTNYVFTKLYIQLSGGRLAV